MVSIFGSSLNAQFSSEQEFLVEMVENSLGSARGTGHSKTANRPALKSIASATASNTA